MRETKGELGRTESLLTPAKILQQQQQTLQNLRKCNLFHSCVCFGCRRSTSSSPCWRTRGQCSVAARTSRAPSSSTSASPCCATPSRSLRSSSSDTCPLPPPLARRAAVTVVAAATSPSAGARCATPASHLLASAAAHQAVAGDLLVLGGELRGPPEARAGRLLRDHFLPLPAELQRQLLAEAHGAHDAAPLLVRLPPPPRRCLPAAPRTHAAHVYPYSLYTCRSYS